MSSSNYDFHDPRSPRYWTNVGDVTTGVYDPRGGGSKSQWFQRRMGMETSHVNTASGTHAENVAMNQLVSKYNMPRAYGPDEVQTSVTFHGQDNVQEFRNRMAAWSKEFSKTPAYKSPESIDARNLAIVQAERQIQREMVDEGKATEFQQDHYGNHTGRYRTGKVIAASPGWDTGVGKRFSNLNAAKGDADFERGRERLLKSNAFGGRNQPTQGMFTPIDTQGLSGPRGEQVIAGGSFRFNPEAQAVGVSANDYHGRVGADGGAPYADPRYAMRFQEVMGSRVQPGDLVRMAASARENNAAHAGQNVPVFSDSNAAGQVYLDK